MSEHAMISLGVSAGFITLLWMLYWAHRTLDKVKDDDEGEIIRKVVALAFGTWFYPMVAIIVTIMICSIYNQIVS